MKKMAVSRLVEGDVICKQVISGAGVLLESGTLVKEHHIALLRKWEIESVWINDREVMVTQTNDNSANQPKKRVVISIKTNSADEILKAPAIDTPVIASIDELKNYDLVDVDEQLVSTHQFELGDFGPADDQSETEWVQQSYNSHIATAEEMLLGCRLNRLDEAGIIKLVKRSIRNLTLCWDDTLTLTLSDSPENYLVSHSLNSCIMSLAIGMKLNLQKEELETLGVSALLHDIGMARVEDLVWKSTDKLTETQMFPIWKHTIFGSDTLAKTKLFKGIPAYVAYQHHERNDRSGYPKAKKGSMTHRFSQIVACADVFSALTSPRTYRPRLQDERVRRVMNSLSFSQLSGEYTTVLMEIAEKGRLIDPSPQTRILIVEDDSPTANLMMHMIESPQLDIVHAIDGKVALEKCMSWQPSLILLDLMMPVMNGYQFLDELQRMGLRGDAKVIVITAKATRDDVVKGQEMGISGFIRKPFSEEMVREKIFSTIGIRLT